jgi:hypothetical protein
MTTKLGQYMTSKLDRENQVAFWSLNQKVTWEENETALKMGYKTKAHNFIA